jgi:predicted nucleic acid-binding protein
MKNSPICVDASLVVALLVQSDSPVQRYWQGWISDGRTLICPALLPYEVVNALHQYWRHSHLPAEIVQDLINVIPNLPLHVQTHPQLHERAASLARKARLAATYDAHYVALAQLFGGELWTLDARLQRCFAEITPIVYLAT